MWNTKAVIVTDSAEGTHNEDEESNPNPEPWRFLCPLLPYSAISLEQHLQEW